MMSTQRGGAPRVGAWGGAADLGYANVSALRSREYKLAC